MHQFSSVAQSCPTLCDPFDRSTPSFSVLPYLPKFAQTDVHWVSDAIPTSHPLSPFSTCLQYFPALGSFAMSQLFTSGGQSIGASALASVLLIDWFDLLVVQGTLKNLLQNHSSKASIFLVLSFLHSPTLTSIHDYWKNHSFDYRTFVNKVMSLLFNMLPRLVTAFLPRSKCLLISWLRSPSAVILEPRKNSLSLFPLFPHLFAMKWWHQLPWS